MTETLTRSEAGTGVFTPIAEYGLLSDCNSAALASRAGAIDWLCFPRFDSPAVFARILDPAAGHWSIRPAGEFTSELRYADGSLVLETTFTTGSGVVRLRDALLFAEGQRGHDIGRVDHRHPEVRIHLRQPVIAPAATATLIAD